MINGLFVMKALLFITAATLINEDEQEKKGKQKGKEKDYEIFWDISDDGVSYQYQFLRKDK